jgi:hypothetical protein
MGILERDRDELESRGIDYRHIYNYRLNAGKGRELQDDAYLLIFSLLFSCHLRYEADLGFYHRLRLVAGSKWERVAAKQ